MYYAFGPNLDDMSQGIPVYDYEGIRILLPGVVEREACSVVFTRPGSTALPGQGFFAQARWDQRSD
jgi:hypothetical protein